MNNNTLTEEKEKLFQVLDFLYTELDFAYSDFNIEMARDIDSKIQVTKTRIELCEQKKDY